jgi:hypothetical protein
METMKMMLEKYEEEPGATVTASSLQSLVVPPQFHDFYIF